MFTVCHFLSREVTYPPGLVTRRGGPWLFRAVSVEAGGCNRSRRHGGIPAHVGTAAATPRGGVTRGAERPSLGRGNHTRRGTQLAQDRAAARRSLLDDVTGAEEAEALTAAAILGWRPWPQVVLCRR